MVLITLIMSVNAKGSGRTPQKVKLFIIPKFGKNVIAYKVKKIPNNIVFIFLINQPPYFLYILRNFRLLCIYHLFHNTIPIGNGGRAIGSYYNRRIKNLKKGYGK
mgnify:CR=1 FL=1